MIDLAPGVGIIALQKLIDTAARIFGRDKVSESAFEQRTEAKWEKEYRDAKDVNFSEILSFKLTNYVLYGSSITTDSDDINIPLQAIMAKSRKWCQMMFAVGRVYLVPMILHGDTVYTDIIMQSAVLTTEYDGDTAVGFQSVSDIRKVGEAQYARLTDYSYNRKARIFSIRNVAVNVKNGGEVSLSIVSDWADIQPYIEITDVDRPLFAFVDCPRDNRQTDKTNGASITFGAHMTMDEIRENFEQATREYEHKASILGVDMSKLEKTGMRDGRSAFVGRYSLPKSYIKTSVDSALGKGGNEVFQVYSPDIRADAYEKRENLLSRRLEKQVGLSSGILSPADATAMATATEVRRANFDTVAVVDAARRSIERAMYDLCYAFQIYNSLIGIWPTNYKLTFNWSDNIAGDPDAEYQRVADANRDGIVSDLERRMKLFPGETPEQAQEALDKARADKDSRMPDGFDNLFPPEGAER